jgi:hypothetical protein
MTDAEITIRAINQLWELRVIVGDLRLPARPTPDEVELAEWWEQLEPTILDVSAIAERKGLDSTLLHRLARTRDGSMLGEAEDFVMRAFCLVRESEPNPRAGHRNPTATERAVLQVLQEDGFIGIESLAHLTSKQRPTGAYLAKRAVGRSADGQFKAVLSHMVDLGWIGNGQHERVGPGYFLKPMGQAVFRSSARSGPSPD